MFALLDGNNFYVAAEIAFRPALAGKPVVVLSNNDGCVISRSNEARALGIKMGAPWFKVSHLADSAGLVPLSANFALYGDISDRMMSLAAGLGPAQEVYSIDECFIGLHGMRGDLVERARKIRGRILQWIGVPCCIGIAPTKTLAKLSNHIAKQAERKPGSYPAHLAQVCNLGTMSTSEVDELMRTTGVGEVWGVGSRIGAQLEHAGVQTVHDLVRYDTGTLRSRWGVVLERTQRELQGIPCIELEESPAPRKEIASTRSFVRPITSIELLIEAVTTFATTAAVKLRGQACLAGQVMVFARTSPFRDGPRFSRSCVVPVRPTGDTRHLVAAAIAGVRRIYEPGYALAKAGVMLLDLQPDDLCQGELSLDEPGGDQTQLMTAVDAINQRYGRGAIGIASAGPAGATKHWQMRQERKTPAYTTNWAELPIVRA